MNNAPKGVLIHDSPSEVKLLFIEYSLGERPVRYQLVGTVTAYQGYDV
jgi:hypothetical protein